jgi:O-palmitoleoyl-L-serine hydrolase
LDREPFKAGAVAASEVTRQGWKLWSGVLPEACALEQKEPWRCYFGHRLYNTLKCKHSNDIQKDFYQLRFFLAPLFVFQWLFDEAQMRADSVGAPVTPQQWDYIHEMGGALRQSLDNVTAVFAPACIGHSVLTKRDWQNIKIDDVSLTDSLRCWENSLANDRKITLKLADSTKVKQNKKHKKKNQQNDQQHLTKEEREQRRKERRRQQRLKMTPEEREQMKLERREKRRQERLLQKQEAKNQTPRAQRSPQEMEINNKNLLPKIIENEPAVKQQQKKRRQQANHRRRMERLEARNATRLPKHHKRNQQQKLNTKSPNKRRHGEHNRHKQLRAQNQLVEIKEPKKCGLRMLERCSWPQCNHSCPTLTNPLTGEEMKFLELLTSFGLDMDAVAQALGVDMQTLNNMDHRELIKLFTESAS